MLRLAYVQFNRSLIWGNCAPTFANEIYVQLSGTFNFDYCDVDTLPFESYYGGTATHSYEVTIASDPLFCAPGACLSIPSSEGDYGLAPGSPCLPARTGGYLIGARGEGCAVLSVNPDAGGQERIHLSPNPARENVTVYFQAGPGNRARITVHDLKGCQIRQVRPEFNEGVWTWNGLDASGRRVAPGVYFIRLEGSARPAVRQVVLVP